MGSEHGGPEMRESVLGTSGSRWGSAPRLLTARPQVPVCSELIGPPHLWDFWFLSPPLSCAPGREGVTCLLGEIKENWANPVGHICQKPGP